MTTMKVITKSNTMKYLRKTNKITGLVPLMVLMLVLASCSSSRVALAQGQHMDPVCGVVVNEQNAINYTYRGNIYYFDSEECRTVFRKNPEKFSNHQQKTGLMNGMNMGWAPITGIVMAVGMTAAMIIGLNH